MDKESLKLLSLLFKQSYLLEEDKIYDADNKKVKLTHTINVIKNRDGSPRIEICHTKKEAPATLYNVIGFLNNKVSPPIFEKVAPYYRIETSVINPLEMSPSESQFLHAVFIDGKIKYLEKNSKIKLKDAKGNTCYVSPTLSSDLIRRESTRERMRQEKNPVGRIQTLDRIIGTGSGDTKVFTSHTLVPHEGELTLKTRYQADTNQFVPAMRAVKAQTASTPSLRHKNNFIKDVNQEALLSQRKKTLGIKKPIFLLDTASVTSYLTLNLFSGTEFFETYDRNSHLRNIEIMIGAFLDIDDLHASGVISRDIKPENIMVFTPAHARKSTVNLIDLGLGKLTKHDDTKEELLGSHVYISPEKWRGDKNTTEKADLYAAYRILGESLGATIENTLNEDGTYKHLETENAIFNFDVSGMRKHAQLAAHHVDRLIELVQAGTHPDPDKRPRASVALQELTTIFAESMLVNRPNRDSLIQAAKCAMQFHFLLNQQLRANNLSRDELRAALQFNDHPDACSVFIDATRIQALAGVQSHDAIIEKVASITLVCAARRRQLENVDHRLFAYTENKLSAVLLTKLHDIKRELDASLARQADFNPLTLDRMETLSEKYEKDFIAIEKKIQAFEIQMKRELYVINHSPTMFSIKKTSPTGTPETAHLQQPVKIIRRP